MAAKHFLICAFLFCIPVAKAQEVAKPVQALPQPPVRIRPAPANVSPSTLKTQRRPSPVLPSRIIQPPQGIMETPTRAEAPRRSLSSEENTTPAKANEYLNKIRRILSKDDFQLYRKKEAKLVPNGNPFGLLKLRKKYYQIFVDYNNKNKHEKQN
jgi:hypothetical protein